MEAQTSSHVLHTAVRDSMCITDTGLLNRRNTRRYRFLNKRNTRARCGRGRPWSPLQRRSPSCPAVAPLKTDSRHKGITYNPSGRHAPHVAGCKSSRLSDGAANEFAHSSVASLRKTFQCRSLMQLDHHRHAASEQHRRNSALPTHPGNGNRSHRWSWSPRQSAAPWPPASAPAPPRSAPAARRCSPAAPPAPPELLPAPVSWGKRWEAVCN